MGANWQNGAEYRADGTSEALPGNGVGDGSRDSHIGAPRQREDKAEDFTMIFLAFSVQGLKITVGVVGFARKLPTVLERERH